MVFIDYIQKIKKIVHRLSSADTINGKLYRSFFLAVILNIIFGTLFYITEHSEKNSLSFLDSLWWSMVTMTTVGYGDYYPKTFAGRFLVSYPCMIIGIGIIGYLVGISAESVLDTASKKRRGLMHLAFSNHIILCNFPGFDKIQNIISELKSLVEFSQCQILLITDHFNEIPEELKKLDVGFIKGNPVYEEVLNRADILKSKGVFILAEDITNPASDEKSFAIGTIIQMIEKENNIPIRTIVELVHKENFKMLKRTNVDGIISTHGITGCLLVQEFLYSGVNSIVNQLISNAQGSQFYLFDTRLYGHTVYDIQLALLNHEINMQVIGIMKGDTKILNPTKKEVIDKGDKLIVIADSKEDFESIEEELLQKEKR